MVCQDFSLYIRKIESGNRRKQDRVSRWKGMRLAGREFKEYKLQVDSIVRDVALSPVTRQVLEKRNED